MGIFVRYGTAALYPISTMQKTASLSSTEAEYMPLSEASKVVASFQQVLEELNVMKDATLTHQDNREDIYWVQAEVAKQFSRRKHIDVRLNYMIEKVDNGKIVLRKVETARMLEASLKNQCIRAI